VADPMSMSTERGEQARRMYALVEELFPICRSITGQGARDTLDVIARQIPITRTDIPTGTPVLDWEVPREWNIRDAYVADADGRRVIDFRKSNLHVVNYSVPVRERMSLSALRPHLHALPDHPDWIPYRTSYYAESWGFCLSQRQLDALPEGDYDVCIDSTLAPGHLVYGEYVLPGTSEDEILIATHICHPSLANDNLSGIAVSVELARHFATQPARRHTVRFLYAPGTIGSIAWLARNQERAARIKHGLTLTCVGDASPLTYKRTIGGDADIDRAAAHVLGHAGGGTIDFFPYGYDERQFNSPGFRLPVGSLMRGRHGKFAEYHTSADNLSFVAPERLQGTFEAVRDICGVLEANGRYRNLSPFGEPQLGRRGLYAATGGLDIAELQLAMLWVLALSDGTCALLDAAERAKLPFATIAVAARLLREKGLLAPA
jgi:aminopeptidase-like protein